MKLRGGYTLLAFGLAALIVLTVVRLGRDRFFYELQLRQQADSIESGLNSKWKSYLLSASQSGRLSKDFSLKWDRTGKTLLSPFYPQPGVQLEWAEYRTAKQSGDLAAQKNFLEKALDLRRSWDRVLALEEWKTIGTPAPGATPVGYETTLSDPEARAAFESIVDQVENGRDFTYARHEPELDTVFFHLTDAGELEAFLPSIESVKKSILPEFAKSNQLSGVEFGPTVLDIRFPQFQNAASHAFHPVDTVLFSLAVLLLAVGVVITMSGTREQRKVLSQRVGFLNQVVHELKTPLTGLKLSAQLMSKGGATDENLSGIFQSVARLDRLFDDIVRINKAEQKAVLESVKAEAFMKMLTELSGEFDERVKIEGALYTDTMTELGRLRVLMRNLISNGVKYGTKVIVQLNETAAAVEVTVWDQGPGISTADAPKIFDEFFRAESAVKQQTDGLGLGLSLVKKLAKELQIDVRLMNPGEKGARFTFRLERVRSQAADRKESSHE